MEYNYIIEFSPIDAALQIWEIKTNIIGSNFFDQVRNLVIFPTTVKRYWTYHNLVGLVVFPPERYLSGVRSENKVS